MSKKTQQVRELLILRHGKSDWSTNDSDFSRSLKDRGKRNAQQIGNWLAEHNLQPEIIISSPAERALTTAEKACKAMGYDTGIIHTNKKMYEADVEDLLQVLSEIPDKKKRVLLVGHNPGMEDLLIYLSKELIIPDDGKILPTAALAHIKINQSWQKIKPKKARIETLIRPKSLPRHFPYPIEDGSIQYRLRPAYYYSQSAIIPYRLAKDKLEILLITSSSNKHWVVPKGIIEPGLSALNSAEKEAFEEAGIEGDSNKNRLGQYSYEKWGSLCNVEVYSMQVNYVLPESQWHESHRERIWVSVEKAEKMLKQVALLPLLKKLQQQVNSCPV